MSVWKSPVFYFGIALVLLVTSLVAAPYVLDWNSYKSDLEAYGKRLTGREVRIGGDVEIRLFPMPRLEAAKVAIGNPEGMAGKPLIHTEVLTLSLQLGSLLNGTLNVESVELLEPEITLQRNAAGDVNWLLHSDEDLRRSTLLNNVRLDQIRLLNGTMRLVDEKRGLSTAVTTMDADMSAASIEGPWKIKGTGNWQVLPVAFNFSSSPLKQGEPFRFGLRVTPGDPSFPSFGLDGGWRDGAFEGDVSVLPQDAEGQKGSVEGGLRPLAYRAKLEATPERAQLTDIRIAPADVQDSGTLIEGTASIDFAEAMKGEVRLKSPRVNLDTLLGAESLATWRSGGVLALAHSFLRNLPARIDAVFSLDVTVLTAGGESLNDVRFAARITPDAIAIENARAGLPGRSAVRMTEGVVLRRDGAAELTGKLAFESSDMRAFMGWASPAQKAGLESWWKGSRGRIKLQSDVTWTPSQFALRNMLYELEGMPGRSDIVLRQGPTPSLDMRLQAKEIDLDAYLLRGTTGVASTRAFDILALLDPLLRGAETFEKHLMLDAEAITLNGVRAEDVALDVATSQSGFEIKAFDIGSVGGARVRAEGLMLSNAQGPSGDVTASLIAEDPRGFLRLVGLGDASARWTQSLGQTNLAFNFNARPDANGPVLTYTLKGTTLPFTLDLSGGITELERGADARVSLEGNVVTADAARLFPLVGLVAREEGGGEGRIKLGFSGAKTGGFASKLEVSAYGTRLSFDGSLKPGADYAAMSGAFSIFADDIAPGLRALGAPVAEGAGGPLRLAFKVAPEEGGLKLSDVVGDHAGLALAGEASFARDGTVAADFSIGEVDFTRLMTLVFMPWSGTSADLSQSFAGPADLLTHGEIWLRPRKLDVPFTEPVTDAALGVLLGPTRRLQLIAPTRPDLDLSLEVAANGGAFAASAKGKMAVDLSRVMVSDNGKVLATGTLQLSAEARGEGRSPAAALAALEGKGAYTVSALAFSNLAPEAFAQRLPSVKSAGDLSDALNLLEGSAGLAIESSGGTFTISKGLLEASPVRVSGIGTLSAVSATADFTQRELAVKTAISLPQGKDLPEVSITYEGVPGSLRRRAATAALASKLGHEMLARDLAELERLKTEQEKLAVQEEEQRQQDQAKFEAYQAQRAELRLRQRELKVHAQARAARQALAAAEFNAFVPEADALNKADLARQRMLLTVKPRMAAWAAENERRKREEEERQRLLAEKLKREEEERLKKIEEEKARAEALRLKAIADEQARILEEQRKAEEAARKAEEARLKAEADAKALAEEQARQEAERKRLEEEERLKALAEEAARQEAERKRVEEEARRKLEELPALNFGPTEPPAAPRANQPPKPAAPKPAANGACVDTIYC